MPRRPAPARTNYASGVVGCAPVSLSTEWTIMSPTLLNFTTFTAMSHVELLEELRRREGDPRRRPHVLLVHEHDIPTDDCSVVAGIENSRVPLPTMFHVRFDDVASSDSGGSMGCVASGSMRCWLRAPPARAGRRRFVRRCSIAGWSLALRTSCTSRGTTRTGRHMRRFVRHARGFSQATSPRWRRSTISFPKSDARPLPPMRMEMPEGRDRLASAPLSRCLRCPYIAFVLVNSMMSPSTSCLTVSLPASLSSMVTT